VKFTSLIRCALALAVAFLLGSCGGGGATAITTDVGAFSVNPPTATWYAGVKNTITIAGGSAPFTLSSSEPSLLPVPINLNGRQLDLVPNNPSVIDAGLPPNSLPVRTVNLCARSAEGLQACAVIKVGQNFLTGYFFAFTNSTCGGPSPCAGGETTLLFDATTNGNILPNRQFKIERIRGSFQFVVPLNNQTNLEDSVVVTSDEQGVFTTVIRVPLNPEDKVGVIKVTDLQSGAYVFDTFVINGSTSTLNNAITVIPDTITLTGPNAQTCGGGQVQLQVFDGTPPYTAFCGNPQIFVNNPVSGSNPGLFTVTVGQSAGACLTAETCTITDARGARTTFTVTTLKGTNPTTPALSVVPNALTLSCGTSGSVTAVGGSGSYFVNSSHPRVTATVTGNTVTITRLAADAAAGPVPVGGYPTTATVSVSDGSSAVPVTVTVPAICP